MKVIEGNILDIKSGMICHQVNCQGVMGAGLALQIKKKWPEAYQGYITAHHQKLLILGDIITVPVAEGPDIFVTHMCAQFRYGRGGLYTDYVGLDTCLLKSARYASNCGMTMYLPYGVGCGLAGGDWHRVSKSIDIYAPEAIIVKLK